MLPRSQVLSLRSRGHLCHYELVDYNVNAENLAESDDIVTVQYIEKDEYSAAAASLTDNFKELEKACPEWDKETEAIHPNPA